MDSLFRIVWRNEFCKRITLHKNWLFCHFLKSNETMIMLPISRQSPLKPISSPKNKPVQTQLLILLNLIHKFLFFPVNGRHLHNLFPNNFIKSCYTYDFCTNYIYRLYIFLKMKKSVANFHYEYSAQETNRDKLKFIMSSKNIYHTTSIK